MTMTHIRRYEALNVPKLCNEYMRTVRGQGGRPCSAGDINSCGQFVSVHPEDIEVSSMTSAMQKYLYMPTEATFESI